ncbi:MAG: hypothetical protein Q8N08_01135 [Methanobacteriaceae archaeon]|nr:hypothetical protein [Methanobacteriaceae archaeon]
MMWFSLKDKTKIIILINIIIILLGLIFIGYSQNDQIILNIGAGLLASGIVAIFYLIYPHIDFERDYLRFRQMGLKDIYLRRDQSQEYSELLKKAQKNIDVLGLGLNQFREDNESIIKEKSLNGVAVRLLVVDSKSPILSIRSYQENDLKGETIDIPLKKLKNYAIEVNKIIDELKKGKKIQIKRYNAVPSTMIFRIDDIMFVGPYLHNLPSRTTITFKIENNTELFKQFENHFNELWNDTGCTFDF